MSRILNLHRNNINSPFSQSLAPATKEFGWREFMFLLVYAVGLTTVMYLVRYRLTQPLTGLNYSQQSSRLASIEFTGTVAPAKEFKIAAATPAIVKDIYVKIGDRIKPNQPLMSLKNLAEDTSVQAKQQLAAKQEIEQIKQQQEIAKQQVLQLEQKIKNFAGTASLSTKLDTANLSVFVAQLRSEQVPLRQRQDSIERAKAVYEQAMSQQQRMEQLYSQGAISKSQLEQVQADLQIASADLASAKAAVAAARNLEIQQIKQSQFQRQLQVTQQQQQLAEMKGQLEVARLQYEQATRRLKLLQQQLSKLIPTSDDLIVKATDTGAVVNLPVAIGDQIFAGTTLVGLAKLGALKVQVPVSASLINSLHIGQRAAVQVGMGKAEFDATVVTINPLPAKNLTYTVEVQFENSVNALLVGQSAKVHFLPE